MSSTDTLVDRSALREYLAGELGDAGGLTVEEVEAGSGNDTYFVTWGGRELVLRRPPAEPAAPELLHHVLREYEVLDALGDTWVPTPAVVAACEDASVIGAEFYLMERLEGATFDEAPDDLFRTAADRRAASADIVDTLAKIHNIDYGRVGLSEFGDPEGFNERQIEQWMDQLEWSQERTGEVRELTEVYELGEWLADNVPEPDHHAIFHGDYRPHNLLFAPGTPPRVVGVVEDGIPVDVLFFTTCRLGCILHVYFR